ncbi:MAG: hypothetical protein ACK5XM_12815, partial [Betaproteobacteria bacterium]
MTVTKMTRFGAMAAALLAQAFLFGCSFNAYLDKQAPEIRPEDIRRPSNPSPVQLSVAVSGGAVQADAAAEARQIDQGAGAQAGAGLLPHAQAERVVRRGALLWVTDHDGVSAARIGVGIGV